MRSVIIGLCCYLSVYKVTAVNEALIGGEMLTEDNLRAAARQGGKPLDDNTLMPSSTDTSVVQYYPPVSTQTLPHTNPALKKPLTPANQNCLHHDLFSGNKSCFCCPGRSYIELLICLTTPHLQLSL